MINCLKQPMEILKESLNKLKGYRGSCYQNVEECDYIKKHLNDKEKFELCIQEAIKKLDEASKYTNKMNSNYPYYTSYEELNWVSKEEFDQYKGKLLDSDSVEFGLIVKRYEYGEWYIYQDGLKYGLYV